MRMSQSVREAASGRRARVTRDRALRAAVALADEAGLESLTMRSLAQKLGVVPMALYKHVANKDDLIDGMVDIIISETDPAPANTPTATRSPWLSRFHVLAVAHGCPLWISADEAQQLG